MKKIIAAVLLIFMVPAIASAADQTVRIDPISLSYGGIGIGYQYNRDKDSAWTFEYASYKENYLGGKVSAGIIDAAYKKAFSGNVLGNGAFWRAGVAQLTSADTNFFGQPISVTITLPTVSVGYDYKFGGNWVLTGELAIAAMSFVQIGYTF